MAKAGVNNRRPFYSKCAAICSFVDKYIVLTSIYVRHDVSMIYHCVLKYFATARQIAAFLAFIVCVDARLIVTGQR